MLCAAANALISAIAALVVSFGAAGAAEPRRIVSLNLCTDAIVIDLVARDRIAALSHLAADPLVSPVADRAAGIAWTRGEAETVLALDPDLVLAGGYTTPATLDLLERVGRRIVRIVEPNDVDGIRAAVTGVAEAVGEVAGGRRLIARLDASLAAARADLTDGSHSMRSPTALVYQINGLTTGPGTFPDALMTAVGLRNHAAAIGVGVSGSVPLETLLSNPPELLVLSGPADEYRTVVAESLRHPALATILAERPSVMVPWRYWLCGTHYASEAIERLADSRRHLQRHPVSR
jgi:iron complex transport system substrate-binding protein